LVTEYAKVGNPSYREWEKINPELAKDVMNRIWKIKLTGKKPGSIY